MIPQRTIASIWLALMFYAVLQSSLVVRAGNAPFVPVLIGTVLNEHLRLALLLGCWWLLNNRLHTWQLWQQIVSYGLMALVLGFMQFGGSYGLTYFMAPGAALGSIVKNAQWIVLQSVLENGIILASMVLVQYRREIKRREERERELRLLNTQMELAALRAQINPHFLFNALNTVNALVGANPEQARHVLEMLADLLRYTLESDKRDVVSLSEELDFVRKYLAIEQERFGKRLQTRIESDETLLDAHIPPMLIQPLVENAVKHGVSPKAVGGTVTVRVFKEADSTRLCVEVADDGVGMKAVKNIHGGASTGIGLANTDARLQKLFGEESALYIESSEHGVTARFSVPRA